MWISTLEFLQHHSLPLFSQRRLVTVSHRTHLNRPHTLPPLVLHLAPANLTQHHLVAATLKLHNLHTSAAHEGSASSHHPDISGQRQSGNHRSLRTDANRLVETRGISIVSERLDRARNAAVDVIAEKTDQRLEEGVQKRRVHTVLAACRRMDSQNGVTYAT